MEAGEKLLRQFREQAKEVAKEEAQALVGRPAAVAFTYLTRETISRGMLEKALEIVETALQHDPKYVNAYLEKGRALKRQGKVEEALAVVEEALQLEPDNAKSLYNRACYKCILKKPNEEILNDLENAFELLPDLKEFAQEDEDLEGISNLEEFKHLINQNPPPA